MTRNENNRPPVALIVGSGFSAEARLPTTTELVNHFLKTPRGVLSGNLEERITSILTEFWRDIFGFASSRSPSLEDHFTVLDLAANSGHHLGTKYPPKKLRAIRRMSIHRIFQLLDLEYRHSEAIEELFGKLDEHFDVSVVTLNWDIVAERHINRGVDYGIEVLPLADTFVRPQGVLLLKVHGSSNWIYCDCCRRVYGGAEKSALHKKAYLEVADFDLFDGPVSNASTEWGNGRERVCRHCGNLVAGRVATFSYRKAFSINQFQTIWDHAHEALSKADTWLFIGYSMPEADFEFRHLLKSAQLARNDVSRWTCEVVLKDDDSAAKRYMSFFGLKASQICQKGLAGWVEGCLDLLCREKGGT